MIATIVLGIAGAIIGGLIGARLGLGEISVVIDLQLESGDGHEGALPRAFRTFSVKWARVAARRTLPT
jgi:hypothetical protein